MSAGTPFYRLAERLGKLQEDTNLLQGAEYDLLRERVAARAVIITRSVTPRNKWLHGASDDHPLWDSTYAEAIGSVIALKQRKTVNGHAVADWVINGRDWSVPLFRTALSSGSAGWGPFAYARPSTPQNYPQRAADQVAPMLTEEGALFLRRVAARLRGALHG